MRAASAFKKGTQKGLSKIEEEDDDDEVRGREKRKEER